ncbi:MAG: hypothetical protein ABIK28_25610 [Planctomycetota bacterium]
MQTTYTTSPSRVTRLWLLVPFIAISLFVLFILLLPNLALQDDAYITFRYSQNLVRGFGPVYNPGTPVEGYTNFLWMIIMAGVIKLNADPEYYARLFGIISGAGLILLCWSYGAKFLKHRPLLTAIAPLLLVSIPGFVTESVEGLETSFFAFLLLGSLMTAVRDHERNRLVPWHAVLFALASMTRPEGTMVFALAMACLLIHGWMNHGVRLGFMLRSFAVYALIFVPYFLWRLSYYGYPFPNTFYAKTGGGAAQALRGLDYIGSFIGEFCWVPLPLALLIVLPRLKRDLALFLCTVVTVVYMVYVALVGGDFKPTYRFLIPVAALACLIYQAAVAEVCAFLERRKPETARWCAPVFLILSLLIGMHVYLGSDELRKKYQKQKLTVQQAMPDFTSRARAIGKWVREHAGPGDQLAISTAGAIAYFSDIPVIDMLGLNDLHIARSKPENFGSGMAGHECGDVEYVLSLQPRFILLRTKIIKTPNPPKKILSDIAFERDLISAPAFKERYEAKTFPVFDCYGLIYCRKD